MNEETKVKSPLRSIREYCIDCSGGSSAEVKLCPVVKCSLFAYRFGKRVNGTKRVLTDELRAKYAESLARARSTTRDRRGEQGSKI
jgi:hypothetical protein